MKLSTLTFTAVSLLVATVGATPVPEAHALAHAAPWAAPEALAEPGKSRKKRAKKVKFVKKGACSGTCPSPAASAAPGGGSGTGGAGGTAYGGAGGSATGGSASSAANASSENSNANTNTNINQIIIYVLPGSAVLTGANVSAILPAGALPVNATLGAAGGVLIVPGAASGSLSTTGSTSKSGSASGPARGEGHGQGAATASVGAAAPVPSAVLVPVPLGAQDSADRAAVEPETGAAGVLVVNAQGQLQVVAVDTAAVYEADGAESWDQTADVDPPETQASPQPAGALNWGFSGTDLTMVNAQTQLVVCADQYGYGVVYSGQVPASCPGSQPLEMVVE